MHLQLLIGRVAITTTKLEAHSGKLSGNKGTNFLVSPADRPESRSSTDLKPRREPIWVPEHGLTLLFEPANSNAIFADVVFVHGLQGHPYKTWLYKGKVEKKVHDEVGTFRSLFCQFSFCFSSFITID